MKAVISTSKDSSFIGIDTCWLGYFDTNKLTTFWEILRVECFDVLFELRRVDWCFRFVVFSSLLLQKWVIPGAVNYDGSARSWKNEATPRLICNWSQILKAITELDAEKSETVKLAKRCEFCRCHTCVILYDVSIIGQVWWEYSGPSLPKNRDLTVESMKPSR